jgi:hypothetical protein
VNARTEHVDPWAQTMTLDPQHDPLIGTIARGPEDCPTQAQAATHTSRQGVSIR